MSGELHFTDNIRRLRLRPGDVIVIEANRPISREHVDLIQKQIRERFPDNDCIVLSEGLRLHNTLRGMGAS